MDLSAAVDAPVARPVVQVAGGLSGTGAGPGPDHVGRDEGLAGRQRIGGGVRADAGQHVKASGVVIVEGQAEVAAPGQGAGDNFAGRFAEFARAQAQHKGGIVPLGGLHAAAAFDDLGVVAEPFALHLHLAGPAAPGVGEQVAVGLEVHRGRGVVEQFCRLLPAVCDFGMGEDDVFLPVGFVDQFHLQGGDGILQGNFRGGDAVFAAGLVPGVIEFRVMGAVGIAHVEGGGADENAAGGRDRHRAGPVGAPGLGIHAQETARIGDAGAVVPRAQVAGWVDGQDELGLVGMNIDDRGRDGRQDGRKAAKGEKDKKNFPHTVQIFFTR